MLGGEPGRAALGGIDLGRVGGQLCFGQGLGLLLLLAFRPIAKSRRILRHSSRHKSAKWLKEVSWLERDRGSGCWAFPLRNSPKLKALGFFFGAQLGVFFIRGGRWGMGMGLTDSLKSPCWKEGLVGGFSCVVGDLAGRAYGPPGVLGPAFLCAWLTILCSERGGGKSEVCFFYGI